jgi:acyl-CoA thioester hydrolase
MDDTFGFKVHIDIEIRFRDLDAFGHVNNAVYFTYLEMGRVAYMRALSEAGGVERDELDFPFILGRASCRFLATSGLGQTLRVAIRASSVGTKSFEFEYEVSNRDTGKLVATAKTTQVFFDYEAKETRQIPASVRDLLEHIEGRPLFT